MIKSIMEALRERRVRKEVTSFLALVEKREDLPEIPKAIRARFSKKVAKIYHELEDDPKNAGKSKKELSKQAWIIAMKMWKKAGKRETKRIEKKPKRQKRVKTKRHRRKKK